MIKGLTDNYAVPSNMTFSVFFVISAFDEETQLGAAWTLRHD